MTRVTAMSRRTFQSLAIRNYRLFFAGQAVSQTGTWMQSVAQAWLVLRLTDSGSAVGIVTGLQFLPMLLGGVWAGAVVDRADKRRVLITTQAGMALVSLGLAAVVAADAAELWMVYVAAFLFGSVNALDVPARQSFVTEMVGQDSLPNAIALNSAIFNGTRVVGPALGAFFILGADLWLCFLFNAVSYGAVILALRAMRTDELQRSAVVTRQPGQIRAGLRYVWSSAERRWILILVAVVGTFAFNFAVVLPLLARDTFDAGPGTFGLLSSAMGVGAFVGALASAGFGRPSLGRLVRSCAVTAVCMLASAAAPTLVIELVVLALLGAAVITFMTTANALLQLGSDPDMRGRVMALYALVFIGSTPFGGPLVGWVSEEFGPRFGLALGGVASVAAAVTAIVVFRNARWDDDGPGIAVDPAAVAADTADAGVPGTASAAA